MHRGYTSLWRKIWSNAVLIEPGRRFSRLEAWLYITNVLASGTVDQAAGLKRGEFVASTRGLAEMFHWSRGAVLRFLETLSQNSMIMRVGHEAGQEAGHFIVCNYETYNPTRDTKRDTKRDTFKESSNNNIYNNTKDTHNTHKPAGAGACVSPQILVAMFQQHNQALPEVKALTAERLHKCRSRINQAVRDGCLEQYLEDFGAAVKKAQSTTFLRGEGARGWRASSDWFVANHLKVYGQPWSLASMKRVTTHSILQRRHYHATTHPSCGHFLGADSHVIVDRLDSFRTRRRTSGPQFQTPLRPAKFQPSRGQEQAEAPASEQQTG